MKGPAASGGIHAQPHLGRTAGSHPSTTGDLSSGKTAKIQITAVNGAGENRLNAEGSVVIG